MKKKPEIRFNDLTQEEKDNLVGVFAWLLKEDRRQNPHLYRRPSKKDSKR